MNRIKDVLREKGVTQKDLASRLGISEPVVSVMVGGNPTLQTLNDIAKALGVRVSELIDEPASEYMNCPHCGGKIKVVKE